MIGVSLVACRVVVGVVSLTMFSVLVDGSLGVVFVEMISWIVVLIGLLLVACCGVVSLMTCSVLVGGVLELGSVFVVWSTLLLVVTIALVVLPIGPVVVVVVIWSIVSVVPLLIVDVDISDIVVGGLTPSLEETMGASVVEERAGGVRRDEM